MGDHRCIFCGEMGILTDEHVLSVPVRSLMGVRSDTAIEWTDGSQRLWAGRSAGQAADLSDLSIRCVCQRCNNKWMKDLDHGFAGNIRWWTSQSSARLGEERLQVIHRYLAKLLWVVRLGEDWATFAWLRGEAPEPEFIPLSIVGDGLAISSVRPARMRDLELAVTVGAARIHPSAALLLNSSPVQVQGLAVTSKVGRVNAAVILTLRRAGLRLWVVASSLGHGWHVRWPSGVVTLTPRTRHKQLRHVAADEVGSPWLCYQGASPVPDLEARYAHAFQIAHGQLAD